MKTTTFIEMYSPCSSGREFAERFETMAEVWEACERPDWLFWILKKCAPIDKEQSVKLAILFAEDCLKYITEYEDMPKRAIEAAKNWLENPCMETRGIASMAYTAIKYIDANPNFAGFHAINTAGYAANAASVDGCYSTAAAAAACGSANCAYLNSINDYTVADFFIAKIAKQKEYCGMIRQMIPNPFKNETSN